MSVQSKLYYWVECDGDRCPARCPDGDEYSAGEDREEIITMATDSRWVLTAAGEFFCEDCVDDEAVDTGPRVVLSTVRGDPLPGLAEPRACPDCEQGKHRNCTGEAWDDQADDFAKCPCTNLAHIEVRDR